MIITKKYRIMQTDTHRKQDDCFAKRDSRTRKFRVKYVSVFLAMVLLSVSVLISDASAFALQADSADRFIMVPHSTADAQPSPHSDTVTPNDGYPFIDVMPGESAPIIEQVQQRLMELGYLSEDEPSEYYGGTTEQALQLFERSHGLTIDGLLDSVTYALLFSQEAKPYTVSLGDTGDDVAQLQNKLRKLGYMLTRSTGEFGPETEVAVKRFQLTNAIMPSGIVDENTWEMLFHDDAKEARISQIQQEASEDRQAASSSAGSKGAVATHSPDKATADKLISIAKAQLGKKYKRGGKGPDKFDCSGFVFWCLNEAGCKVGYMTSTVWPKSKYPKVTKMSHMKQGDIICFKGRHVGIYMGGGKMIDASESKGKVVIRTNILNSSYWKKNFICAKRVL